MTNLLSKRILLVTLVFFECLGVSFIMWRYYQSRLNAQRVLGLQKVAVINKENIVQPEKSPFKYYGLLKPDTVEEDQPDWLSYKATYSFNSDGLNDRFNYSIEKPENTYRIIALGDSYTFGHFVNTEDSWPEKLEDLQNNVTDKCNTKKIEVLNLGMRGFDIPYIVERYKTVGAKYQPDLIIWFESGTGFSRYNERTQPLIEECEKTNTSATTSGDSKKNADDYYRCWNEAEKTIREQYTSSGVISQLTEYLDDFFRSVDPQSVYYLTFKKNMDIPNYQSALELWQNKYPLAHFQSVIPSLEEEGILPDGHPSAYGQYKIAEAIHQFIQINQEKLPNRCH